MVDEKMRASELGGGGGEGKRRVGEGGERVGLEGIGGGERERERGMFEELEGVEKCELQGQGQCSRQELYGDGGGRRTMVMEAGSGSSSGSSDEASSSPFSFPSSSIEDCDEGRRKRKDRGCGRVGMIEGNMI